MKKWIAPLASGLIVASAAVAWAGSSGGPPGGGGGGGGAEPELIALVLFSLVPGAYFIRRAMAHGRAEQ